MTTAGDIVTGALQLLGSYDPGQQLTAADSSLALSVLNDMLDSWSNENLACYDVKEVSFVLVPGQQTYTIGAGGQINAQRPLRLIQAPVSAYTQDFNGNNYPLRIISQQEWNSLSNRSPAVVTSTFPEVLFYDPQFPLGVLNFSPTPSQPYQCFVDAYLQLANLATLASTVSLPPGYAKALKFNLAIDLKPYFADGQLDPEIEKQAAISLANIKRTNMRKLTSGFDSAIVSRAAPGFNIYTNAAGSNSGSPS